MGFPELRALVRTATFGVLGQPATVTVPGGDPVATRVIWLTPLQDGTPAGADFKRDDPRRAMAIRRDEVPTLPRGTTIAVTEPNLEAPALWKVDSILLVEPEHYRAMVRPVSEES